MPYLIDGSNLGGVLGGAAGSRSAGSVVRELLAWARERRGDVLVVFDGPERAELATAYGPLRMLWSGERAADDLIVERLGHRGDGWVVVTSDRELARRCRATGARVESVPAFLARSRRAGPARPATATRAEAATDKPPAHAEERDYWRRIFAEEE